jgi:prepilin-type N-terminal cleavage/methylation domain-containing protein
MKKGFTLVELLVVIAIVSVVAALVFPVLGTAKRRAKETVTISNLRQCGMALLMYADEHDGFQNLPVDESVVAVLEKAPTCDPMDTWRASCQAPSISPMIGSYAYVRHVNEYKRADLWALNLVWEEYPTLLLSIFAATNVVAPFEQGERQEQVVNMMPDRVVRFLADGSARTTTIAPAGTLNGFQWWKVFSRWVLQFPPYN